MRVPRTITIAAAAVVAAGVAAVPTSPAQAAPFQPTRHYLNLPSGTDDASVFAINNNGTIVGSVDDRAVKWNASTGVMTYLPRVPGYSYAIAWDINDDGDIVGSAASSSTSQIHRPVRWKPSGTVEFLAPEGSAATAISNDDHIAGWSGAAFGPRSVVRFVNNGPSGSAAPRRTDPSATSRTAASSPDTSGSTCATVSRTRSCTPVGRTP